MIHPPGLGEPYLLKPVLRLVNNLEVGTIDGTVVAGLIVEGCEPAVYLFTGADVVPDDVGSATPPLASTAVTLDDRERRLCVSAGLRTRGRTHGGVHLRGRRRRCRTRRRHYLLAAGNATVVAGQTTTVDFAAP